MTNSHRAFLMILTAAAFLLTACLFPVFPFTAGTPDMGTLDATINYAGGFYVETFGYSRDAENIWHYVLVMPESEAARGEANWVLTSLELQSGTLAIRADRQEYAWALDYLYEAPQGYFTGTFEPGEYVVAAVFLAGPLSREEAEAGEDAVLWAGITGGGASTQYQPVTIESGKTSSIVFEMTDRDGWACPWLYVSNGQTFERRTEILRQVRDHARTEITPLGPLPVVDGSIVIRVVEEKDEVTYIDALSLRIDGVPVRAEGNPVVAAVDGELLILHQGEAAEFRFPVTGSRTDEVSLVVTGYYVPGE